jgi:hypothetical protein
VNKIFYVLILATLISCKLYDDRKTEVLITDTDYVEEYREFSPDSSMLLISYSLDLGAFGYGQAGTAILKVSDTTKDLRQFSIPNTLTKIKWMDNKTISAQYDILPSIRTGQKNEIENLKVNDVTIKVSPFDYISRDYHLEIEHRETSPNGQWELVAYRYLKDRSNLNLIHISVIPVGGQIPKYGNYFIADMQSDYILYGTWNKDNQLDFYSNGQYADLIQYYFVHDKPKIKYQIITDDNKFGGKYRWTEKSGL